MILMDVQMLDEREIKRRLGNLSNRAGIVMARAANRSVATGKKVIRQETSKKYMVTQGNVDKCLKSEKASQRKPFAVLTYRDEHKNLFYWANRGKSVVAPNVPVTYSGDGTPEPKVYAARVFRNSGMKELGGDRKPFVQIAAKSGNMALFRRVRKGSNEIEGVAAPALPQVIKNRDVQEVFREKTSETLLKRLEHEIDYELRSNV